MTVQQLKDILEDAPGNAEVRLAHQPGWAFEYSIRSAVWLQSEERPEDPEKDDGEGQLADAPPDGVLYIGEGEQLGYLPGWVRDAVWN